MATDNSNSAGAITPQQSVAYGASSNAIGAIINSFAQRDLLETQNNINMANWQTQNEYNLPKNQLQRYLDAGLSRSAAAQAVAGIESSAGSIGSVSPSVPSSGFDALKHYYADQQMMVDKRIADAEVQRKEAERDYYNALTNRNQTLTPLEADKIVSDTMEKWSQTFLNQQEKECRGFMLDRAKRFEKWELQELKTRITNLNSESYRNIAQAGEARSQAVLNNQFVNESDAREEDIRENTKTQEYENRRLQFEEITRNFFHADPRHAPWQQFIEASAHGDEGATAVWNAILDFADEGISTIKDFGFEHPLMSLYFLNNLRKKDFKGTLDNVKGVEDIMLPFFKSGSVKNISAPFPKRGKYSFFNPETGKTVYYD